MTLENAILNIIEVKIRGTCTKGLRTLCSVVIGTLSDVHFNLW